MKFVRLLDLSSPFSAGGPTYCLMVECASDCGYTTGSDGCPICNCYSTCEVRTALRSHYVFHYSLIYTFII